MIDPRISRRNFALWAAVAAAASATPLAGLAQGAAWPQPGRPVRLLVGLAAGGSLDVQARSVAKRLAEITGAQVIVENKPGASMMLSATEVMRAAPDGYTLLYAPSSLFAQNPHTLSSVPYDPFKDFTPITMAARGPLVLTVHQSLPVQNAKDLVAWAKANPGKLNFASFGTGTSSHIYAMAFAKATGIEITHVPYKGTADAVRDLLEGRVQAYFDAAPTAIQNATTGRIRMVAVASPRRMAAAPDVQTFNEQGIPGLDLTSWISIVGPANMRRELQQRINTLLVQTLNSPEVKEFYAKGAWEASPSTPAELTAEIRVAYDQWGAMVKAIGFEKQ
jgi:tripartite-type tricarboxylate transporter receptor subunit TctC